MAVDAAAPVAVLGAGTMGHGIAQVAAAAGHPVHLYDVDDAAARRGVARIGANLDKGVALGKVTPHARDRTLSAVTATSDLADAVAGAAVVVEAAPESLALKRELFRRVEPLAGEEALLATNTSSLSVAEVGKALEARGRFLGLHFFNPVHLMALVEVVRGPETAPDAVDSGTAWIRTLGKEPVVIRDAPGFATSRLGVLLGLEAIRMVEQGVAEPEAIDRAMELGYRHPMGPLRLTDLVGLDVRLAIAEYLHEKLGSDAFRPPELLRRMVAEGRTGRKAGRGFYEWKD